jgi:hypothetical protein
MYNNVLIHYTVIIHKMLYNITLSDKKIPLVDFQIQFLLYIT